MSVQGQPPHEIPAVAISESNVGSAISLYKVVVVVSYWEEGAKQYVLLKVWEL